MQYKSIAIVLGLLVAASAYAQNPLPAGTILPASLSTSIDTQKAKPGQRVIARIMQDVPLPDGTSIPAGSKVVGEVVNISRQTQTQITLRFDRVVTKTGEIPIAANLRAIASYVAIGGAQVPTGVNPDRGSSAASWTTVQVGGDVVYRGGGPVTDIGSAIVGTPVPGGVLVRPVASRDCSGSDHPQAMWLFSASACGVYGLENLQIAKRGPEIVLSSPSADLKLPKGTGLLLETTR